MTEPSGSWRSHLPAPRRWAVFAAGIGAGIGAGLLGTSLHSHAWHMSGMVIPVGALAALVLLAAVELFVGLWSRNTWVVVMCGAASYLCAGLLSIPRGGFGMISGNIQGNVWLYGMAVVTPLMAWWVSAMVRAKK
ncbi:hypothetical protein [Arthrobacter sp. GMC3]|uniref:hypothetical protein n=1 Tax=Arthrobacter sp. GMC3 TaxID=2058894 RepID=UPI000CE54264|nr:hypothetical protein [Arthrobacter sp. GMC3]